MAFLLYWSAFLFIFFFHFVLLLKRNARVLFLAFYFNYERLSEFITDVLTMFIEVICFYVIQSTIAIKPGIITELIQILKSNP